MLLNPAGHSASVFTSHLLAFLTVLSLDRILWMVDIPSYKEGPGRSSDSHLSIWPLLPFVGNSTLIASG